MKQFTYLVPTPNVATGAALSDRLGGNGSIGSSFHQTFDPGVLEMKLFRLDLVDTLYSKQKKRLAAGLALGRASAITAGAVAALTFGASIAQIALANPSGAGAMVTAMPADEGVPQNLVTALKADEGVPHHLLAALAAEEGTPFNLRAALQADEGVPLNLLAALPADEGTPLNLRVALKADEGVPHNLVTA